MENKTYRLQLLNHEGLFDSREAAVSYIEDNLKPDVLIAEPAVVFYGNDSERNAILAIGSGKKKVFIIDVKELQEKINLISEIAGAGADGVKEIKTILDGVVKACGFTVYTDGREQPIEYKIDIKDPVIGDSKSLTDAVVLLSEYVQQLTKTEVESTESIDMGLTKDGKIYADVKISEDGNDNDKLFDDNIIGLKKDGIFASVNLEYNETSNCLEFTTSGIKNGKFSTEARTTSIPLPTAIKVIGKNKDEDPIEIVVDHKTESGKAFVSGKVKVSEATDNILEIQDGSLYVKGTAKNIAYKGKTVFDGIKSVEDTVKDINEQLTDLNKSVYIKAGKSDSTVLNVERDEVSGAHTLDVDVKLSDDGSIVIAENGLSVKADFGIVDGEVVLKIGNRNYKATLPVCDNAIQDISYNKTEKTFTITYKNDSLQPFTFGVADMLNYLSFDENGPVELHKHSNSDGTATVTAVLKLRSDDNLLKVNNSGELYVEAGSTGTAEDIKNEKERAIAAEAVLTDNLTKEIERAKGAESANSSAITQEISDRKDAISAETSRAMGIEGGLDSRVSSLEGSMSVLPGTIATETSRAQAEEARIAGLVTANTNEITSIKTNIAKVEERHSGDITRVEGKADEAKQKAETAITSIAETNALVSQLSSRHDNEINVVNGEINNLKDADIRINTAIEKLNADENTDGSVKFIVKEKIGVVDSSIQAEISRATNKENEISTKIDGEISRATNKDAELADAISTKLDKDKVKVEKTGGLQYTLYVDEKPAGVIEIPKDQFLTNVAYDQTSHKLTFTFDTATGVTTQEVDLDGLMDVYKAGNGLQLNDGGVFEVRVNELSENYLTVTKDGIAITGIDAKLAEKADSTKVAEDIKTSADEVKSYANDKFQPKGDYLTTHQSLEGYAKETYVDNKIAEVSTKVNANVEAIKILNGNDEVVGSVAYAVKKVSDALSTETTERQKINETVATIQGSLAGKADLSDVVTNTALGNMNLVNQDALTAAVSNKVNSSDVYTKAELYNKDQIDGQFVTKTDADGKFAPVAVVETANKAKEDLVNLTNTVEGMKFAVADTDAVGLTLNNGELKASFKVNQDAGSNALKVNGAGAFVNVSLEINTAENKLLFNDGNGVKEITLPGASVVTGGSYDKDSKKLILNLSSGGTVEIPAADLFNQLQVGSNSDKNPIFVEIDPNGGTDGKDVISVTLQISNDANNLITKDNGTLYASKNALDHTATYGTTPASNVQEALNQINEQINGVNGVAVKANTADEKASEAKSLAQTAKDKADSVGTQVELVSGKLGAIESSVGKVETSVSDLSGRVGSLETRMTAAEQQTNKISAIESNVSTLTTTVSGLSSDMTTVKSDIQTLKGNVETIQSDIRNIKTDIENIQKSLGDDSGISEKLTALENRIKAIEDGAINTDFGTY